MTSADQLEGKSELKKKEKPLRQSRKKYLKKARQKKMREKEKAQKDPQATWGAGCVHHMFL